jgi:hypothetical protein
LLFGSHPPLTHPPPTPHPPLTHPPPVHQDLPQLDALAALPQRRLHRLAAADDADPTNAASKLDAHIAVAFGGGRGRAGGFDADAPLAGGARRGARRRPAGPAGSSGARAGASQGRRWSPTPPPPYPPPRTRRRDHGFLVKRQVAQPRLHHEAVEAVGVESEVGLRKEGPSGVAEVKSRLAQSTARRGVRRAQISRAQASPAEPAAPPRRGPRPLRDGRPRPLSPGPPGPRAPHHGRLPVPDDGVHAADLGAWGWGEEMGQAWGEARRRGSQPGLAGLLPEALSDRSGPGAFDRV